MSFVRRRISHQVLLSQVPLDLRKSLTKIAFMLRKVRPPTGLFSDFSQCSFINMARIAVTNADGVNQSIRLLRAFYGLMHFHVTARVFTVCEQDDCAPSVFR